MQEKRRHRTAYLSMTATLLLLGLFFFRSPASAAAPAASPSEPIEVNIGLPVSNYWPGYVARDLGLFEKAGLKPKFFMFTTGAPLIAAMKAGSLDVVWTGLATLFMMGQGIPLTYLYVPLNSSSQEGLAVNPKSGIRSFRDLAKAKAVGAPTATCAQISAVLAAKSANIPMSDIHLTNLNPELLLNGMKNGSIDAAFIWGPWSLLLQEAGYPVVSWDRDYDGEVCATAVAARPKFLEEHPDVGCRLVKVQAMTLAATKKDPGIAIKSLEQVLGISPKLAKATYETLEIPSLESQVKDDAPWSLTSRDNGLAGKLYRASEVLYQSKVFRQPLSKAAIQKAVDPQYLQQYLSGRCE